MAEESSATARVLHRIDEEAHGLPRIPPPLILLSQPTLTLLPPPRSWRCRPPVRTAAEPLPTDCPVTCQRPTDRAGTKAAPPHRFVQWLRRSASSAAAPAVAACPRTRSAAGAACRATSEARCTRCASTRRGGYRAGPSIAGRTTPARIAASKRSRGPAKTRATAASRSDARRRKRCSLPRSSRSWFKAPTTVSKS